jgi:Transglutaminase-like superfamily
MSWLLAQSLVGLITFDFIVTFAGFARVHALARRFSLAPHRSRHSDTSIVQAVAEACVWYPKDVLCLQRSWVASLLLRRNGFDAQIVIGCRPAPLTSHAWVEVDGRVINDRPQYQKHFHVLDRL